VGQEVLDGDLLAANARELEGGKVVVYGVVQAKAAGLHLPGHGGGDEQLGDGSHAHQGGRGVHWPQRDDVGPAEALKAYDFAVLHGPGHDTGHVKAVHGVRDDAGEHVFDGRRFGWGLGLGRGLGEDKGRGLGMRQRGWGRASQAR
jgi:hypothetical protein